MPSLVLGPMLRYTDGERATVWVETDAPCEVAVLGHRARTFTVHGHHYALVLVEGLAPGRAYPYRVTLDGRHVWGALEGPVGTTMPEGRIRTFDPDRPVRVVVGSCRASVGHSAAERRTHGVDALRAYALRMARAPEHEWPDVLLLVGDQVYADETTPQMRAHIASRRSLDEPPGKEVADFGEYAELYRLAWSDPVVRWLFATVPTAMVFDDHDIRDDWNTSDVWRARMARTPWWHRRIVGGLGAYWLYQHLGNLGPDELAVDPVLDGLRQLAERGEDGGALLDRLAADVDADPTSYRWSYARDLGHARLVMVDSRCARVLGPDHRLMLDDAEWAWVAQQAQVPAEHLLVGTSLPYLLPPGIHDVEAWNEAVCAGAWGSALARWAERVRQGLDLEHWASFGRSFEAMAELLRRVATRPHPPASVLLLSGDVHYSYLARASFDGAGTGASPVAQVVCSPVRNPLGPVLRYANVLAQVGAAALVGRLLARAARVPRPPVRWAVEDGPWFANALATVTLGPGSAHVRWEGAPRGAGETLEVLGESVVAPAGAPDRPGL